ncbi:hypothetical protein Hanom_Chr17g01589761 [Helianthus anomalus]
MHYPHQTINNRHKMNDYEPVEQYVTASVTANSQTEETNHSYSCFLLSPAHQQNKINSITIHNHEHNTIQKPNYVNNNNLHAAAAAAAAVAVLQTLLRLFHGRYLNSNLTETVAVAVVVAVVVVDDERKLFQSQ